jgi:hypothetical protein
VSCLRLVSGAAEWKRDNSREPARALDQRPRRRCPVLSHDEITLPVSGNLAVCYLFRPVLNGTHAHDPGTGVLLRPRDLRCSRPDRSSTPIRASSPFGKAYIQV